MNKDTQLLIKFLQIAFKNTLRRICDKGHGFLTMQDWFDKLRPLNVRKLTEPSTGVLWSSHKKRPLVKFNSSS